MTWGEFFAAIATVISIVTVLIAWKKLKPEKKVLDSEAEQKKADAAQRYQAMLMQSAQREQELMTRVEALETRLDTLEKELEATKKSLGEWQNWAERLAHQIRSRGLIPVPFSLDRKTRPPAKPPTK